MTQRTLIRGGTVVDGSGRPARIADVLIEEGRIAAVGASLGAVADAEAIDATGCLVTPGFIDIHSHSDFTLLVDPRAVSSVTQGVTTEVVGNCGWGCAVIGDLKYGPDVIYGYRPEPVIDWTDTAGYLGRLDKAKPAVNVIALVPNGQLRLATVGLAQRPASLEEIEDMKRLLRQSLEQGAWGYSSGLEYATEAGASEAEVTALCAVTAEAGGLYTTHARNRDDLAVEAVEEAIRTADKAGVPLQVSHFTLRGGFDVTARAIEAVDRARARGQDVTFDMHTRFYGTTYLKTILPFWAFEGGPQVLAKRLADPAELDRMRGFQTNPIAALRNWDKIVLLDNPAFPEFSRRSMVEVGRMMGKAPLDAAYEILRLEAEAGELFRQMVILMTYNEDLLGFTYDHPTCTIGSDATALAPDGPLAGSVFHGSYTWASWFYRRMVRETGRYSREEGIRKLSTMAAERLGLSDRGVLRPGARADIAVFDPETFGETGTTFEPSQTAVGMKHVLVNGVVTLRDGALTGARAGAVLRRPS